MLIRDRIKELRRVRARDLLPNPKNWRIHPKVQTAALRGLLAEVGYADALLARELPDGRLVLLDGHLRAETTPSALVPVLILDVSEAEGDKILLTLDPLAGMAESDSERLQALQNNVRTDQHRGGTAVRTHSRARCFASTSATGRNSGPRAADRTSGGTKAKVAHGAQSSLGNRATSARLRR
jgi:hypothetical protein